MSVRNKCACQPEKNVLFVQKFELLLRKFFAKPEGVFNFREKTNNKFLTILAKIAAKFRVFAIMKKGTSFQAC
jgi:hypothetical protein